MNNDLISRSALKKEFNLYFGGVSHAVIAARIIDDAPAVDAVEVCRCRECKYSADSIIGEFGCYCRREDAPWFNDTFEVYMNLDDFCSYGERREDG